MQRDNTMIKVIIERKIADGLELNYLDAARNTLRAIVSAPGYISGESLTNINNPSHRIIITNWTSVHAWDKWYNSAERREVIAQIAPLLEGEERISILENR